MDKWEYKILFSNVSTDAPKLETDFNDLAKDGWEYINTITVMATGNNSSGIFHHVFKKLSD
ncbi:MAG: DUF4177 domain-containing protein [Chloroflexi bacterium]|nr:DUF4177 domain-containing protein [Chloroflexota bacterium]